MQNIIEIYGNTLDQVTSPVNIRYIPAVNSSDAVPHARWQNGQWAVTDGAGLRIGTSSTERGAKIIRQVAELQKSL